MNIRQRADWPDLTQRQRDLALLGFCPFCEQNIRAHQYPITEKRERQFERARIDLSTGHRTDCAHQEIRL